MTIDIKIGIGEALDRVSILEIKLDSIADEVKLDNIKKEYKYLMGVLLPVEELEGTKLLYDSLYEVNSSLWEVEDKLRELEKKNEFGVEFIELARSVYHLNDERAAIKKKINQLYNSEFVEEKSYK
jgi:DNA-dependent RNA polymerase auxiliary subunit epsilon